MNGLRISAAQINCVVGDLVGNLARIRDSYDSAVLQGCDAVVFPELTITGYPPEDLLLRAAFIAQCAMFVEQLASGIGTTSAIVGFPELHAGALYNSAAVMRDGGIVGVYRKQLLPNYSVFDEARYFEPGTDIGQTFAIAGVQVGVTICEDAWSANGPMTAQVAAGAEVCVNLNASPYLRGRLQARESMLSERAVQLGVPIVYCNLVGGQDELVFDGGSLVVNSSGAIAGRARQYEEDLLIADLHDLSQSRLEPTFDAVREVYEALVLGTRDYVRKTGFHDVAVAMSGGIDSAIVAAIAVDALGPEHVHGVLMPSRYSSDGSVTDAALEAQHLGIETYTVPIEAAHGAFESMLAGAFAGTTVGLAEENMQARIRANVMMSISNKFNWMVLTTGNKSEMATGYATLYGDMAGGYAVIKDVPKTLVYQLCEERNTRAGFDLIPRAVIEKPPSAELRPDQKDSDSLPDYAVLDPIIEGYVEDDLSVAELVALGHEEATVRRVAQMVDRNEYKRRQAAPGVRITRKAFGKDRRLPITNRWPG